MDKFERIFELHKVLSQRRTPISHTELEEKLGRSRATVNRDLRDYRDYLGAPISYDREREGYVLDKSIGFELPGLWFNPSELMALMTSHRLLSEVQPGVLEPYLSPFRERLEKLLQHKKAGSQEIFDRIRILPMAQRETRLENFQAIADALVGRRQLRIQYHSRGKDELSERWVSPQRIIYYRDNWYLDAWCHKQEGLRTFSLDRLNVAESGEQAIDIADVELDAHFTGSYGIFAGQAKQEAVIHFTGNAAKWVADETWHPEQQSRPIGDDGWELTVPYSNPSELVMDILKYGPEAKVVSPLELKEAVTQKLTAALKHYQSMD